MITLPAQTTAFTYQGSLTDNGTPQTGTHDFEFRLFTAASAGSQVGSTFTADDVAVNGGLFSLPLDFGPAFDGTGRYLEIRVRPGSSTGSFTLLNPRQLITSTPYAVKALEATTVPTGTITSAMLADGSVTSGKIAAGAVSGLGTPDGSNTGAVTVSNGGLVGVGIGSPEAGIHITTGRTIRSIDQKAARVDGAGGFAYLDGAWYLAVENDLMAVSANGDNAVTLVNLTDKSNPTVYAQFKDGDGLFTDLNGTSGLDISNGLLAVAGFFDDAVTLINVSVPANPVRYSVLRDGVGGFNELDGARDVSIAGGLLAIAAFDDDAVTLVDVSNPASPVLRAVMKDGINGFNDLDGARQLAIQGNLLVVAASVDDAVTLVDISNPAAPVLRSVIKNGIAGFDFIDGPEAIALSGNTLAITSFENDAVTLADISDPAAPKLLGYGMNHVAGLHHLDGARGVRFHGGDLVVAGYESDAVSLLQLDAKEVSLASAGWVGIGTAQPLAPLHVDGNVIVEDANEVNLETTHFSAGSGVFAEGSNSTAMGHNASANHSGTFVWGDGNAAVVSSSADNQFTVRASGGTRIFSNAGATIGVQLNPGANSWSVVSDRDRKKDVDPVDTRAVLDKLADIPISTWHYDFESSTDTPHIGPMAQDFKAAFYPGRDDKSISTHEIDGVALAAIQGLNGKLADELTRRDSEISELKKQNAELLRRLETLERELK